MDLQGATPFSTFLPKTTESPCCFTKRSPLLAAASIIWKPAVGATLIEVGVCSIMNGPNRSVPPDGTGWPKQGSECNRLIASLNASLLGNVCSIASNVGVQEL